MGTLFDRVSGLPDSGSRGAVQYRRSRGSAVEFRSSRSRSIVCRAHLSPWWITESLCLKLFIVQPRIASATRSGPAFFVLGC
jgi:hypothetical protein